MNFVLHLLLVVYRLSINGRFQNQLPIKENRVDYVENVLPYFEVGHDCDLLDLDFENFFMGIEDQR